MNEHLYCTPKADTDGSHKNKKGLPGKTELHSKANHLCIDSHSDCCRFSQAYSIWLSTSRFIVQPSQPWCQDKGHPVVGRVRKNGDGALFFYFILECCRLTRYSVVIDRLARVFVSGYPHHVNHHGNRAEDVFRDVEEERIRQSSRTGRTRGAPGFIESLEEFLRRRLSPVPRGRPRRKKTENNVSSLFFLFP